jgi:hypothetical protein
VTKAHAPGMCLQVKNCYDVAVTERIEEGDERSLTLLKTMVKSPFLLIHTAILSCQ